MQICVHVPVQIIYTHAKHWWIPNRPICTSSHIFARPPLFSRHLFGCRILDPSFHQRSLRMTLVMSSGVCSVRSQFIFLCSYWYNRIWKWRAKHMSSSKTRNSKKTPEVISLYYSCNLKITLGFFSVARFFTLPVFINHAYIFTLIESFINWGYHFTLCEHRKIARENSRFFLRHILGPGLLINNNLNWWDLPLRRPVMAINVHIENEMCWRRGWPPLDGISLLRMSCWFGGKKRQYKNNKNNKWNKIIIIK